MSYESLPIHVREVFVFLESESLLKGCLPRVSYIESIQSFEIAKTSAWSEDNLWLDLRENAIARAIGVILRDSELEKLKLLIYSSIESSEDLIARSLTPNYSEIVEETMYDMQNVALNRLAFGIKPGLFENIFDCYRLGGWPCGWRGQGETTGRLLGFFPHIS